MRIVLTVILCIMFMGLSHADELKIGLIPEQNVFKQMKRYKPLGEYIGKKIGKEIRFTILSRYGNIIDNFNRLELDGAFWGSFTGALAIKKLGIEHIARPVNLDGTSSYRGYIFVHKYSIIDSVDRMRNMTVAFVDKATTAGYIFPVAYFRENGVKNIDTYFKEHYFTGSHDAAIHAVLNKEADIGCAKNTVFDMMSREDTAVKDNLVILSTSPDVPSNGLGLRKDIPISVRDKLKNTLLEMDKDPEGKNVLKEFKVIKFIETTKEDYQPVFDATRKAGINILTYEYINK
ncbi:phosphate/phosphite/phosphonate ABC transporter substrate-binding protein [bacterium]|nr:MAG: phosphate/phosphite/phosphonate ABC transporter substrate-binding protein [bacterium]